LGAMVEDATYQSGDICGDWSDLIPGRYILRSLASPFWGVVRWVAMGRVALLEDCSSQVV